LDQRCPRVVRKGAAGPVCGPMGLDDWSFACVVGGSRVTCAVQTPRRPGPSGV
jgi:hypothetical protein